MSAKMSSDSSSNELGDWCFIENESTDEELSENDSSASVGESHETPPKLLGTSGDANVSKEMGPVLNSMSQTSIEKENGNQRPILPLTPRSNLPADRVSYWPTSGDGPDVTTKDHASDGALESSEGEHCHAACHQKKNSSSSDISIIDDSLEPFVCQQANLDMMRPIAIQTSSFNIAGAHQPDSEVSSPTDAISQSKLCRASKPIPIVRRFKKCAKRDKSSLMDQPCHVNCYLLFRSLCCAMIIVFLYNFFYPYDLCEHINDIQTKILACLGKQDFEALQDESRMVKLSLLCKNDSIEWLGVLRLLGNRQAQAKFAQAQRLFSENKTFDLHHLFQCDVKPNNMKLIIHHMEDYNMLPKRLSLEQDGKEVKLKRVVQDEEDLMAQMKQAVSSLTALNENLHNHVNLITQNDSKASGSAKGSLDENAEKDAAKLVCSLEEKVKLLSAQNEQLKTEINYLRTAPKVEDFREVRYSGSEPPSSFEKANAASGKPADVAKELHRLMESLESKFHSVEKLYKFLGEFKSELKFLLPSSENNQENNEFVTWDKLMSHVEKFIQERHKGIKEAVSGYKNIDVAEALNGYVQHGKKHAENTLNLVSHFVKEAGKKTKEIIDDQVSEIDMEKTVNGVWNMWGAIQNKWSDIKHRFDDLTSNISPDKTSTKSDWKDSGVAGSTENDSCSKKQMPKNAFDDNVMNENNWFLERAALRENHRSFKLQLNWYLRREMYREGARQLRSKKSRYSKL